MTLKWDGRVFGLQNSCKHAKIVLLLHSPFSHKHLRFDLSFSRAVTSLPCKLTGQSLRCSPTKRVISSWFSNTESDDESQLSATIQDRNQTRRLIAKYRKSNTKDHTKEVLKGFNSKSCREIRQIFRPLMARHGHEHRILFQLARCLFFFVF